MELTPEPTRRVLLSLDLVLEDVTEQLRPYIGVVSEIADHTALLQEALSEILGPANGLGIRHHLQLYRIPSDVQREIEQRILKRVHDTLVRALGILLPSRQYRFEINRYRAICIEIYKTLPETKPEPIEDRWAEESGWSPRLTR